ncbi:hypothetical protein RQP46_007738 [Phenoliferia psychrophenolica]
MSPWSYSGSRLWTKQSRRLVVKSETVENVVLKGVAFDLVGTSPPPTLVRVASFESPRSRSSSSSGAETQDSYRNLWSRSRLIFSHKREGGSALPALKLSKPKKLSDFAPKPSAFLFSHKPRAPAPESPMRPEHVNSTPIDLKKLLVADTIPVHVVSVGEPVGHDFVLALAAIRGSFDGLYSSHDFMGEEEEEPWFPDQVTLLSAIVNLWRRAEVSSSPSQSEQAKLDYRFGELCSEAGGQDPLQSARILRSLSLSLNIQNLSQFYRTEKSASRRCIFFPFPPQSANTARLIADFIASASRCQRTSDLLLIAVKSGPRFAEIYDKAGCGAGE